jgi:hypothetical protein
MLNEPASAPDNDSTLVPTPSSVTTIFETLSAAPFSGVEITWFDSAREGGVSDTGTGASPQKPATPGGEGVLGDADRNVASAV